MKKTKQEKRQKKILDYLKNPNYCACGCGKIVMPDLNRRGLYITKYIKEHYDRSKFNPMSGKKQSGEAKKKIGEANCRNNIWCKGLTKDDHKSLKKISENMIKNNPGKSESVKAKIRETKIINGTLCAGPGVCKWIEYDGKKLQGKFELKFAKFLNSIELKWTSHKDVETFRYLGLDGKEHIYQPDFRDENGIYYDPHSKYFWDDKFEHKIREVRKNNPNKEFIVFHEDNYYEACKIISDKHNL